MSKAAGAFVVGLDIGGTKIIGALANAAGDILAEREVPTRHDYSGVVVEQVADVVDALAAAADVPRAAIVRVAAGVPAAVHPVTGRIAISPNIAFPQDEPLALRLAERLGCPVEVDNDVNVAAFGECCAGVGRGRGSLAFVAFGTGVGAGLVLDGRVWKGSTGKAGEICFLPITDADPYVVAPASSEGPYEEAVGSFSLPRRYGDPAVTVKDIFARAAAGEGKAQAVIDTTVRLAAQGLASLLTLFDPDILVLGGGIGSNPAFVAALRPLVAKLLPEVCPIEISALGPRAGLVGAVGLALAAA